MSVLDRADVDTDQIMPKQFLKRIERTGFGEFLFYDWAKEPGWDLPPTRSSSPGATSAAARRASTRPGGSRTTASGRSSRRASRDIFYSNCTKIGLLPVVLAEDEVRAVMAAGRGARSTWRSRRCASAARRGPFEIDQEIKRRLLERPRRHRRDAAAARTRSTAYERDRERSGPGHHARWRESDARLGRGQLRPRLRPPGGDGRGRCSTACRCAATRPCSTPAAARAASPPCCSSGCPRAAWWPSTPRRRWSRRPASASPGDRATVLESGSLVELELDEPVDAVFSNAVFHWIADHDAAVRAAARRAAGRAAGWSRSAAARATSTRFRRLADEVAAEPPYAEHMTRLRGPWNYASPEETEERLRAAGFDDVRCWLAALAGRARRAARVRPHRLPRQPPRGAAGGAARAVRRGGGAPLRASRWCSSTSASTSTPRR